MWKLDQHYLTISSLYVHESLLDESWWEKVFISKKCLEKMNNQMVQCLIELVNITHSQKSHPRVDVKKGNKNKNKDSS